MNKPVLCSQDDKQPLVELGMSENIQNPAEPYTKEEIDDAIEVIKMLIKVRDRVRKEGKINW